MTMARRTKIVCTIGPASNTPDRIRGLIEAGMNVARLNFSHGDHAGHRSQYDSIRATAAECGANVAILMDLQGPKIRTGALKDGQPVELRRGAPLTITTDTVVGDAACVSTTYAHLPYDVQPGNAILIADGLLELRVIETAPPNVRCEVVRGGMLGEHKGINLPGIRIAEPSMTEKDREDLAFGLSLGVDYVALSFVRTPDDVRELRGLIDASGVSAGIVAKIERPEALECFEEIVSLCDAIMVARGDLGVELPFEDVPGVQKRLILTCNDLGVPVITATQMLESMIEHVRPTRAEVADVANAIFDGTDAVMLSGETASGQFPLEACAVMARVAAKADDQRTQPEMHGSHVTELSHPTDKARPEARFSDALGYSVNHMAQSLSVRQIVCYTRSGYTARAIARYRPSSPILAITDLAETQRRLALLWGVTALCDEEVQNLDDMLRRVDTILMERAFAQRGDIVMIVAGYPIGIGGRTNLLKLHTVGESLPAPA
jgi:pyruvate kinase